MPATKNQQSVQPTNATPRNGRIAVIVNPVSCPNGPESFEAELGDLLRVSGQPVAFVRTSKSEGAQQHAVKAIKDGATLLIAAGGDGTVMETVNASIGSGVPVGIVPLGTGNVLAVNLKLPMSVPEAADVALNGSPSAIDLVKVSGNNRHFGIMGGIGFDARIMHETPRNEKQKFGRFAYLLTALKHIRGRRFMAVVTLDDRPPIRLLAKSVLIANMGEVMPGLKLFEEASSNDGIIEIGLLKANRMQDFLRLVTRLLFGRPDQDPTFDAYRARRVRVQTLRPQPFQLDGDPQDQVSDLDMEVAPGAATLILPVNG